MTTTPGGGVQRGQPHRVSTWRLLGDQVMFAVRSLWRSRVVFVFTLLFPLTWLLLIGVLAGNEVLDATSGIRVMQFVTPGAAVMGVLYATLPTVATALAVARERGELKRLRGTPLPGGVYLAGRIGASVVFATGSLLTMLLVGVLAYDVQIVGRTAFATVVTVMLGIACFTALGLAVATLARSSAVAQGAAIAAAVVLSFLSGLFTVGGEPPVWQDRVAWVFPLKALHVAVTDQFDPWGSGAGWDLRALAILGAWAVVGVLVATWRYRWEPASGSTRRDRARNAVAGVVRDAAVTEAAVPRPLSVTVSVTAAEVTRPPAARMVVDQAWWATRQMVRDFGSVFFAVAMPVGLFVFFMASSGAGTTGPGGAPIVPYAAAGMIAWGVAVTAFINLPESVARDRERGVLKRLRGTPLTPTVYLVGRVASALLVALVTAAFVIGLAVVLYDHHPTWVGLFVVVGVVVLGTLSLAACGFALATVVPTPTVMNAVGLGILIPLAFASDVFGFGADLPVWMSTVGSVFPLKHLAGSVRGALSVTGPSVSWPALAVMAGWLVGAGTVAVRTFRWQALR